MTAQEARRIRWIIRGGILLVAVYTLCQVLPQVVVYAPSASLPKGWYLRDFATRDIAIGDLVVVEMPGGMWTAPEVNGRLPRLLKHVAAIPGDRVCWDADGMTVGTSRGTVTYPYHSEKIEFRRPTDCLIVPPGFLILVGTHPRSFDSRYIGAVSGHLLQMRVIPLWTWEAA